MMDILERLRTARAPFAASKDRDQARVHNACLEAEQEIAQLRLNENRLRHGLHFAQLKAENAKQKAVIARDAADHAVQYAIDAETAAISALNIQQRASE